MIDGTNLQGTEENGKPPFCLTPTAQTILTGLESCQSMGEMGVIVGSPGAGKTEAITHYVASSKHSFHITISPSTREILPCLSLVSRRTAGWVRANSAYEVRKDIVDWLDNFWGPPSPMLIIDEAQHLADAPIEELRSIHDELKIGLVFVGNVGLVDRWSGKRGFNRVSWAQLTSRFMMNLNIKSPLPEDVAAFCQHHEIADKKAVKFLTDKARLHGGLRNVVKRITVANRIAGIASIEFGHLEEAERIINGGWIDENGGVR